MYLLVTVACLLLTVRINGFQRAFFDGRAGFNPCNTRPGVFFYPDPSDAHKFYQCDASGHAYSQSCATPLVWDDSATTCNWASAVVPPSPPTVDTTTTPVDPPVTDSSWTTPPSQSSLCKPVNPCGKHGECVETNRGLERSRVVIRPHRRFSCICNDGWMGRLCDKPVDSLSDQTRNRYSGMNNIYSSPVQTARYSGMNNIYSSSAQAARYSGMNTYSSPIATARYSGMNTYSSPIATARYPKYVNYGLTGRSDVMGYRLQKRVIDPNLNKEMEVSSTTEQSNPTNIEVTTPIKAKF